MRVNRNFFLLLQGLTTSSLGVHLYNMAAVIWLVEVADSASLVGLMMLAVSMPMVLCMPFGGWIADSFSRRSIIVLADLCNGIAILGLTAVFVAFDSFPVLIFCLFFTQLLLGVSAGFFYPAFYALLPEILPNNQLAIGNAATSTTINITQVFGRGVGGLLFSLMGAPLLFMITGISYLLSALSEFFIKLPETKIKMSEASVTRVGGSFETMLVDIKQGFFHILKNPGIKRVYLLRIGLGWCMGVLIVNIPFLTEYRYDKGLVWYGYFLANLSLGLIVGSMYAGMQFKQLEGFGNRTHLLLISLIATPMLSVCLAFISNVYSAMFILFLVGIFQGASSVIIVTRVQSAAPTFICGRVMSAWTMVTAIVFPVSGFLGGILIDISGKDVALVQWISGLVGCLAIYPLLIDKTLLNFIKFSGEANSLKSF